ncbi:MAG: type IV toxin-antitoxin system AbiEi family antitoxin domain-containing protein [Nocardioides sp.]|uniref:type IV toxin-antitoxin system AbiEi family antitoxin domain-containing protein n=1 Tax=Nocardioides sp. TaxID=35761 RepID=UPI0039E2CDAA
MRGRVRAIMATNQGLITREQAVDAGMSGSEIDRLVRKGTWVAVRRGVYAEAGLLASVTTPGAKQLIRDRAACLRIRVPFVRSHTTAALELGIAILLPPKPMTHVTRPCVGTHNTFGIKHHLAPYSKDDVVEAGRFEVLGMARTAVDIAREYGEPYGLVAVDRVRAIGVGKDELQAVIEGMRFWPDRRAAIDAVELSVADSESVGETLGRVLLTEMGYTVHTQFGLSDGRRTAWADMRVGRHLIEFDGRVKYRSSEFGGLAPVSAEQVVYDEKVREDFLRGFHLGMSRVGWADVWGPGREAAKTRLRREIEATNRRYGVSIADLAPYIITRRKPAI